MAPDTTIEQDRQQALLAATLAGAPQVPAMLEDLGEDRFNLLEETILPSPKTIELRRSPTNDATGRFVSRAPHIAELYHANSRISPHEPTNAVLDHAALAAARDWFYTSAFKPRADTFNLDVARRERVILDFTTVARAAGPAFARLGAPDIPELAYAVDLLVLRGGAIYRLFPGADQLWLEHFVPADDLPRLHAALLGSAPPAATTLSVIGAAWRYMLLQGPRGYRRTLIDCGRLLGVLRDAAGPEPGSLRISLDFHDAVVDELLKLDGVERGTLAVLSFDDEGSTP